ncbi:MAG: 2OG-Fe dioxygenase family protein [Pseudomonadota bacterium]
MTTPAPPFNAISELTSALRTSGYALLKPADVCSLAHCTLPELDALAASWNDLATDNYLKDGGRYRRRRHSCFIDDGAGLAQTTHRAHWQPVEYNALHGGMHRLFEPIDPATLALPAWNRLLRALGNACSQVKGQQPWFVEAHQFRIDTLDGIGRPTPEGAHRDGVDFVAVLLVGRHHVKGGETRVFEAEGPDGKRFTMLEPWTLLLLDDARVIHESTPIQATGENGHRDTLVLTWRSGAFQGEDA